MSENKTKNKLGDLRNHLFETLEMLKDSEKPMETERARAIADVAHAIINSAKVELRAAELLGIDPHLVDGAVLGAPPTPPQKRLAASKAADGEDTDSKYCAPCLDRRNIRINAVRVIDGTPMCQSCLAS